MEQPIRMPDKEQRLYAEQEYFAALRQADGDAQLARMAEEDRGCGFGFMYMSALYGLLDTTYNARVASLQLKLDDLDSDAVHRRCELHNAQFESVRQQACAQLHEYALRRGQIDIWPQPQVSTGVFAFGSGETKKPAGVRMNFGFFAPDLTCEERGDREIISRKKNAVLHEYRSELPRPSALTQADRRKRQLRAVKAPTAMQRRVSILLWIAARIPLVVMLTTAALFLLGALTGFDGRELANMQPQVTGGWQQTAAASINAIARFFAACYVFMTSSEIVLFSMLPGIIVSGFVFTGVLKLFFGQSWIPQVEVQRGIDAKEELKRLENDPELKKIERAYLERCRQEEEEINGWLKEWFEVCQEKRKA